MIAGAAAALTIAAPLVLAGVAAAIAVALVANRLIVPPITNALHRARGGCWAVVECVDPLATKGRDKIAGTQ
ncbi:hypothetical protein [Sphingomonas sp. BAUL-RG-20F-R05-02]|uniref:hypothetical protein n=1 Tax=Sphingomonas sp. BAUL-RG-20F-R05-02 TaxID=2914830 RepID=UPI001F592522|nr:hypothetical protein [Sphingomonas sp. BAUL-RG-20F-R05-02]